MDALGATAGPISVTVNIGCITLLTTVGTSSCVTPDGSIRIDEVGGVAPIYYSIDGGVSFQSTMQPTYTFSNLPGGIYSVVVKDGRNTVTSESIIVGGLTGATVVPTPQNASCTDNDGIIGVTISGGAPPYTFKLDNGSYGSGTSPTATSYSGLSSGDHTVYVTDGNGCVTSANTTILVTNTLTLTTGKDVTICEGKEAMLSATSPEAKSFAWSPATGLSSTTSANPAASPTTTTTYTVVATWGACTQSRSEVVTVNPAPIAYAGPGDTTCFGKDANLQGSGTGVSPLAFRWTPATYLSSAVQPAPTVVSPSSSTTYHLLVTDGNGCASLNDASAFVYVTPPPVVSAGPDTNVAAGQPVPLHATDVSGSGFTTYTWAPAGGLSMGIGADVVVLSAGESTTYTVTAATAAGCLGMDSVLVKVFTTSDLYVPGAFSPNHDGHNDVLRVVGPSIRELKVFAVYDRYGGQVFTTSNLSVGWDGTRGGRELPPGVYVWMAVGVDFDGKTVERKGTVVLVR
jgi:gliding motility-associated-like protein